MPDQSAPADAGSDSLAADLTSAWDAQESPDSAPAETPSVGAEPSPSPPTEPAAATGAEPRARAPDGKFAKAPDPAKPAPPAEFKVPDKWPPEVKAKLEALHKVSPEHAQFLLEQFNLVRAQQGLVHQERQKLQPLAKTMEQVESMLAQSRQQRALQNIDDPTYIRNLIAAGEVLDKNPTEGLRWLAQRYGVNLAQLANPQAQQPQVDPHIQLLARENAQVKAWIQAQTQGAERARLQQASDWITRFATQKDATGQAVYPHFDDVLPEIIVNVQYQRDSGQPIDVKAAYDRAVRMNDTVWLKVQGARSEVEKRSAQEKRSREIEEAKRAGFSVSGSGGATSVQPAESIRGELERLWDSTHS